MWSGKRRWVQLCWLWSTLQQYMGTCTSPAFYIQGVVRAERTKGQGTWGCRYPTIYNNKTGVGPERVGCLALTWPCWLLTLLPHISWACREWSLTTARCQKMTRVDHLAAFSEIRIGCISEEKRWLSFSLFGRSLVWLTDAVCFIEFPKWTSNQLAAATRGKGTELVHWTLKHTSLEY